MLIPRRQPIDVTRTDRFRPPHCPSSICPAHLHRGPGYRFKKDGSFPRKCAARRREQRYKCATCGKGFSRRSFCATYRLKRPDLLEQVAELLVAGCGLRQIARYLDCAPSTVMRMSVRLGRHAELMQQRTLDALDTIDQPVVFDHFVGFVRSQVERLEIATPVGGRSWLVFPMTAARYDRHAGRSRRKRRLKRRLDAPPAGEMLRSTREALEPLVSRAPDGLRLISDDHAAYPVALRRLAGSIEHSVYPNPDRSPGSDRRRAWRRDEAMFPVDLLHKLLRHSQAHHRRETIAFGRKTSNVLGRAAVLGVWRNLIKKVTERRPTTLSPAIRAGLTDRLWSWRDVLAERLFERRIVRA